MLNPLTPYMAWIKIGAAATALAVSFLGGCHVQAKRDTGKLDKTKAALAASASALGDARDSLRAAATTFDQISAQTRINAAAAAKQIKAGEDQAKQAKADKAKAQTRASALEQQLQAERAGCVDAGRRICGLPLQ